MSDLRPDCPDDSGAWTGFQAWQEKRLIYNLLTTVLGNPVWAQPDTYTLLFTKQSPGADPSVANVSFHSVACVREMPGGAPGIVVQKSLATQALAAPRVTNVDPAAPLTPPLPCDQFTVGRGGAVPQYKVKFKDGTVDGQTVFVDGSSVLALPCQEVTVDALTPSVDLLINPAPGTTIVASGLFVDAFARASVSWSSRSALATGPAGKATFTQTQLTLPNGAGALNTMYFERPPFARSVRVVPAGIMVAGGVVALTARFVSGGTFNLGEVALGLAIGAQYALSPADHDIPSAATHIEITPRPALAGGLPVSVVWGIGV